MGVGDADARLQVRYEGSDYRRVEVITGRRQRRSRIDAPRQSRREKPYSRPNPPRPSQTPRHLDSHPVALGALKAKRAGSKAEDIEWLALADGTYLRACHPESLIIEVVATPETCMAGVNVLWVEV